MTVRNPVVCISCGSKIITRTQIGHKDMQKHSFPCPTCGVVITYIVDLDQKNAGIKFRDPENGTWADGEDGAVKTLTFSDEIVVPLSMPDFISPHIATFGRYDWEKCAEDEGLRQLFVQKTFPYAERCRVHFERGNWDLFDKESPSHHEGPVTPKSRLIDLYNVYTAGFSKFTLPVTWEVRPYPSAPDLRQDSRPAVSTRPRGTLSCVWPHRFALERDFLGPQFLRELL